MAVRGDYKRISTFKTTAEFKTYLDELGVTIPCEDTLSQGGQCASAQPVRAGELTIGNRWAIHPMEGWDGTTDGHPTENTIRRWHNFGKSGAKLIWGGEAVAVRADGRANPNQLMINADTHDDLAKLRDTLIEAHRQQTGSTDGLVIGLQLTHSGRFCRPNRKDRLEPKILYRHPLLDRKYKVPDDLPVMSDDEIRDLIEHYHRAAKRAADIGFDFVDLKHCHGYLGHEFLSAYSRPGPFGGSFENRTRFLREIVAGIRSVAPGLHMGVRLSAFDMPPFKPDPELTEGTKLGPGIPESLADIAEYPGFGCDHYNPLKIDIAETVRFLQLLKELGISLVNLTAGSPYYNPHIQRPALYPPSDGYQPPEDPLIGVARQMDVVRRCKAAVPGLCYVGTGYTYLQEFLPHVANAAVAEGWTDMVGIGRMVLSYPEMPDDVIHGRPIQIKRICRTFSDCTTAPRNGMVSGCYPLDEHYKKSEQAAQLRVVKSGPRK